MTLSFRKNITCANTNILSTEKVDVINIVAFMTGEEKSLGIE
jgi:hypothetical protein